MGSLIEHQPENGTEEWGYARRVSSPEILQALAENYPGVVEPLKLEYLRLYSASANHLRSCRRLRIDRCTAWRWRKEDPVFRAAVEEAKELAWITMADKQEREAHRRAVDGIDEAVFFQGVQVATIKKYSDALLGKLLVANNRKKFAEPPANAIQINNHIDASGERSLMNDASRLAAIIETAKRRRDELETGLAVTPGSGQDREILAALSADSEPLTGELEEDPYGGLA